MKPRASYGISRIDQPEKKNHGYYVRITHNRKLRQRFFSDKKYKGKGKALAEARRFRDAIVAKLPRYKQEEVSRPRRKLKKSGMTGVTHVIAKAPNGSKEYHYWQASWENASGVRKTAKFSFERYGEKEALARAKQARLDGARGVAPTTSERGPVKAKGKGRRTAVRAVPQAPRKAGKRVSAARGKKVAPKKKRGGRTKSGR